MNEEIVLAIVDWNAIKDNFLFFASLDFPLEIQKVAHVLSNMEGDKGDQILVRDIHVSLSKKLGFFIKVWMVNFPCPPQNITL